MKILAIYSNTGSGIPVIYQRMICELARYDGVEIDVLSDGESNDSLAGVRNQYHLPFSRKMQSWYRKFLRWFGTTPLSTRWSHRASEIVAKDYDVVIAFIATSQLTPLVCGRIISEKLGCKFAVYTVDAIPAPGGWTRKRSEFRGKKKFVERNFPSIDYLASSNPHMLEYQLTTFEHKPNLVAETLFTPSPSTYYNYPISDEIMFLYTGNLYGLRNPNYIFRAFRRLLKVYPQAQFMIVGEMKKLGKTYLTLTNEERKHIITGEHTSDLAPLFRRAMILVDIDADREKDPFLSSKIVTYIKANRVILSETGKVTPSREIFAGLNTVIQCDHNEDSLYEGMLRAIEVAKSNPDYSEREPIIKKFSVESVVEIMHESLVRVCGER